MNSKECLVYLLLILFVLFILGQCQKTVENLEIPAESSSGDIGGGASSLYGWGYVPIKAKKKVKKTRKCPDCKVSFVDNEDTCNICHSDPYHCKYADITKNVNIDKYVLKSSVPPCPDMNNYINKSEVPPCPRMPDLSNYILKSEVPPCTKQNRPKCPECPTCPICPKCISLSEADGHWRPKLSDTNSGFHKNPMAFRQMNFNSAKKCKNNFFPKIKT